METPVEVLVSGRTSTLKSITVLPVGQAIPKTFSGERVKNTEGFSWYVSRHYALKTDYDEKMARHYLTLLELSFPHYVELFGRELPEIDRKRMAVIYGKTRESLDKALKSDGIVWDFGGGGITYEDRNASYQYPSGSLLYQHRYILIHECTHQYQMCLTGKVFNTPVWYLEGIADSLSHHVWEESRQRLTVNVLDKATTNNYLDAGLRRFQEKPYTLSEMVQKGGGERGTWFLIMSFFATDIERWMKLRIWRDELFRLNLYTKYQEDSNRILLELFGTWDALDAPFSEWIKARWASFHYVDWGWEQDGDTLLSYGWPQKGAYSQTDMNFPPMNVPVVDPFVLDYPRSVELMPALVGPVRRGVEEPSIGCLVGFRIHPKTGQAGLGLGVTDRSCLKVLVDAEKGLVLDASDLGGEVHTTSFAEEVRKALVECGHRAGLTVCIRKAAVEVVLRTGLADQIRECRTELQIGAPERVRLLSRPLAVLSRGGRHEITPFVDVPRTLEPDLSVPAPPNRWRNPGDGPLFAVFKAAWRLAEKSPPALLELRTRMLEAADRTEQERRNALKDFEKRLPGLVEEIRHCGAAEQALEEALSFLKTYAAH